MPGERGPEGCGSYTAMPKTKSEPKPRKTRSDAKPELESVIVRLEKTQNAALTREALRLATKENNARPDKSKIVRVALDKHLGLKR